MRSTGKRYKTVIVLAAVLLFFVGTSYSAWTDELYIMGMINTSNFRIEFGNEKDVEVRLVKKDNSNKVMDLNKDIEFTATEIDDKDINLILDLDKKIMDELSIPGNMLCVEYPIKTSDKSKVKAINSEKVDFSEPYTVITTVPEYIEIVINDENNKNYEDNQKNEMFNIFNINEEINKNDYAIDFNVYRQIVTDDDGETTASVFIEANNISRSNNMELGLVEYSNIENAGDSADAIFENSVINAQLKAKYTLSISIPMEQFNTDGTV